jgi:hypothetical protein
VKRCDLGNTPNQIYIDRRQLIKKSDTVFQLGSVARKKKKMSDTVTLSVTLLFSTERR